jgi:hypothetical protein
LFENAKPVETGDETDDVLYKVDAALYMLVQKESSKQYSFCGKGELRCNTFNRDDGKKGGRLVSAIMSVNISRN